MSNENKDIISKKSSTNASLRVSLFVAFIITNGCDPKEESEPQRIQRERQLAAVFSNHSEISEQLGLIRAEILLAARSYYRKGKPSQSAKYWQLFHELDIPFSNPSAVAKLGQALFKLRRLVGRSDNLLTPTELNALDIFENIVIGGTALPVGSMALVSLSANLNFYIIPALEVVRKQIDHLVAGLQETNDVAIAAGLGLVYPNASPGKQPVYDFMASIKRTNNPATAKESMNEQVRNYFDDNRDDLDKIIAAAAGPNYRPLPTKGLLFKEIDLEKFPDWIIRYKNDVWILLYGNIEAP